MRIEAIVSLELNPNREDNGMSIDWKCNVSANVDESRESWINPGEMAITDLEINDVISESHSYSRKGGWWNQGEPDGGAAGQGSDRVAALNLWLDDRDDWKEVIEKAVIRKYDLSLATH